MAPTENPTRSLKIYYFHLVLTGELSLWVSFIFSDINVAFWNDCSPDALLCYSSLFSRMSGFKSTIDWNYISEIKRAALVWKKLRVWGWRWGGQVVYVGNSTRNNWCLSTIGNGRWIFPQSSGEIIQIYTLIKL